MNKKIQLAGVLLGAVISTSTLAMAGMNGHDNKAETNKMMKSDGKCGAGKCGSEMKADTKCGTGKCGKTEKSNTNTMKSTKPEKVVSSCGSGKCGSGKCGSY